MTLLLQLILPLTPCLADFGNIKLILLTLISLQILGLLAKKDILHLEKNANNIYSTAKERPETHYV